METALLSERLNEMRRLARSLSKEAKLFRNEHRALEMAKPYFNFDSSIPFFEKVRFFEIKLISHALELTDGHQRHAAALLGLRPTTLNEKMKRYGIYLDRTPNDI